VREQCPASGRASVVHTGSGTPQEAGRGGPNRSTAACRPRPAASNGQGGVFIVSSLRSLSDIGRSNTMPCAINVKSSRSSKECGFASAKQTTGCRKRRSRASSSQRRPNCGRRTRRRSILRPISTFLKTTWPDRSFKRQYVRDLLQWVGLGSILVTRDQHAREGLVLK
jgi:hypothetical protein